MAKRSIPPFVNYWHFPGCFLLKGESIEDCAKRVGKDELCLEIDVRKLKFKGIFEDLNSDPRGHVIDIIFNYTLSESNKSKFKPSKTVKELKFFIKIPINIGFNHKETLKKLGYT